MDPRTASSAGIRLERLLHVMAHAPLLGLAASASQRTAARLLLVSTRPAHYVTVRATSTHALLLLA